MKNNISKLKLTSIITIIIFILCVITESITAITVNAATTYTVIFPVNNGCKIAYYQEYDPDYYGHDGIDIHATNDDTIYAAYAGTVVQIGNSCPHINELSNHLNGKYDEMGNYIKIKGNDGIYYWYYHLKQNSMVVSKNDKVTAGQPIATMGSSGASSGKHLHFRMTTGSGYYSTAVIANPVGKYSGVVNYKNGPYGNSSSISYDAVTTDNYYLKNASTGTYMSVDDATAANGQNISVAKKSTAKAYQFAVSGSKDSGYYFATLLNTGYVVNPYSDTPANGTNITLYKKNTDGTQLFRFKKQSDGSYIISSVYNSNLVLGVNGSNVQLQTNKSTAAQKWVLEKSLKSVTVKFYRNLNSSDSNTLTETFTEGVSNQKFGYNTDGTGKYSYMNEPQIGFGKWTNPGYELLGWSFDKNATTASYKTYSDVVDSWIKNNSPSANLYAVWKKSEKGDVNNDGDIRLSDLTALKQFLINSESESDINSITINSDIYADNKINVFDWIILKRLLI